MKYIPTPSYMGTAYNNAVPLIGGGFSYYNPYMDPRYIRQQQEAERERQQQEYWNNAKAFKELIKSANTFNGVETDEEWLNKQFIPPDPDVYQKYVDEQQHQNTLQQIAMLSRQKIEYEKQQEEARRKEYEAAEDHNESLYDFLRGTGREQYIKAVERRASNAGNIKNLYDKSAYARLLQVQEGNPVNSPFSALNPLVTIDDMEISLPKSLQNERELKRKQFMESIMAQEKGW